MTESDRSLARIERSDLLRLAALAAQVEAGLFARHPDGAGRYAGRLPCRALCQGAALHSLDGKIGVKDFDVWSFYAARGGGRFLTGGAGRPISAPPGSAVIPVTRRRTPGGGSTCSDGRRLALTRQASGDLNGLGR